jgi:hypothetical protein
MPPVTTSCSDPHQLSFHTIAAVTEPHNSRAMSLLVLFVVIPMQSMMFSTLTPLCLIA